MFDDLVSKHPEPEHQGLIATLREQVHNFCNSKVPTNHDELMKLTQDHTMVMMAINTVANSLRRQKMWDRKM